MGFFSDRKARREAAEAQAAAEREASAREAGLTVEELTHAWRELIGASGVDIADVRGVVGVHGGAVFRSSFHASEAVTWVERGLVLVTGSDQLVFALRATSSRDVAHAPVEVIVRSISEVREPREKEDRSFIIVFERDCLFGPPNNPLNADAWELRHSNPDELYRHFSLLGLPW